MEDSGERMHPMEYFLQERKTEQDQRSGALVSSYDRSRATKCEFNDYNPTNSGLLPNVSQNRNSFFTVENNYNKTENLLGEDVDTFSTLKNIDTPKNKELLRLHDKYTPRPSTHFFKMTPSPETSEEMDGISSGHLTGRNKTKI